MGCADEKDLLMRWYSTQVPRTTKPKTGELTLEGKLVSKGDQLEVFIGDSWKALTVSAKHLDPPLVATAPSSGSVRGSAEYQMMVLGELRGAFGKPENQGNHWSLCGVRLAAADKLQHATSEGPMEFGTVKHEPPNWKVATSTKDGQKLNFKLSEVGDFQLRKKPIASA